MKYDYGYKFKSNWEELNLKNLLDDANRMNILQLADRYRIDSSTVRNLLKKYNTTPKEIIKGSGKKINDMTRGTGHVSDMTRACGSVFPKHNFY